MAGSEVGLTGTATATITITDRNDHAPEFTHSVAAGWYQCPRTSAILRSGMHAELKCTKPKPDSKQQACIQPPQWSPVTQTTAPASLPHLGMFGPSSTAMEGISALHTQPRGSEETGPQRWRTGEWPVFTISNRGLEQDKNTRHSTALLSQAVST
ncbi:hypothetical protein P4O66_003268 [Electrophorus voltai]|uniref:Cadherin domain-containing protein n=1 Tax=Electrophorus voltai TaxID=2609070 RepID=A0AAD8YRN5_9TELE|nr:hypothetical protein P4O66_003268 [Electrophorus voltai]